MNVLLYAALVCAQLALSVCKPRVICYYPDYRLGQLPPENIDPTLCTHILFSFHKLDQGKNVIVDSTGSARPDIYRRLTALKGRNPELKVIVAAGGGGAPDAPWSNMISNPSLRAAFVTNTVAYLKQYGFDGLDLDWEFPVCWGGDCNKGPASDKPNFGKLVTELRAAFDKQTPRLSLSAAVQAGFPGGAIDKAYDIPAMAKALDFMSVMTYALAGVWDHKTGHNSAFQKSLDYTQSYVTKGMPKDKVLIGVPFYGNVLTLQNPAQHQMGAPITGAGNIPGGQDGSALYSQMCDLVKNKGWPKETPDQGHDPISYHGNIWVCYDDPYAAYDKSKWVNVNGFGGVMVWEIAQDDIYGRCCSVKFPMLRAINNGLLGTGQTPATYGCEHK